MSTKVLLKPHILNFLRRQALIGGAPWLQKRCASIKLSYVHGTGTKPLNANTVSNVITRAVELFHDRQAVVSCHQNIRKTYQQFGEEIDQLAAGFLSLNLRKGDRVAILSPNRYEWPLVQLAAAKAGLILVPLNPAYQLSELEYCLKKLEIQAVIIHDKFKTQDYYKMMTTLVPEMTETKPGTQIQSRVHPYLKNVIIFSESNLPGTFRFKDIMESAGSSDKQALEELQRRIDIDDPAIIMFTSGTTGNPKAPVISNHSLVNGTSIVSYRLGFDDKCYRYCCPVPLFHGFGCLGVVLFNTICGNCTILTSLSYDPALILRSIEEEKCDVINGTPTMFIDILRHPNFEKTNVSSLKKVMMGGAPCPPFLLKTLMEKLNSSSIASVYGQTEMGGGCFSQHQEDSIEKKLKTVGRVYDYLEAKLIDENGLIVPIGTPGELCVRGFKRMLSYWGDEEKTKETITSDGWLKTGDVGILDDEGYFKISDRVKNMIIRGGENIYPAEIEAFLITHPKIVEVQIVGVPDDRMGEEVSAFIILAPNETMTENELRDFCKGQIAHFKIPRYVQFVDTLPKTASGKVQKFILKEKMQEILSAKSL